MNSQITPLFQTTIWTSIVQAGLDSVNTAQALDELCRRYWQPLYVYGLRLGFAQADAEDAVQAFFAKLLENRSMLERADRSKGRFRTYLLTSFKYFLTDQYARAQTQRRGGGVPHVTLDAMETGAAVSAVPGADSPEVEYDRKWALVLVERAMAATRSEFALLGKEAWFDRLGGDQSSSTPYEKVAVELNSSPEAVKSFVARMKRRFRAALEREVAATVAEGSEIADEMAYLATLLEKA